MSRSEAVAALDRVDPALGAFITLNPDRVLKAAEAPPGGRLSGVLIAVKDIVDTAGERTTYGSSFFADHVPTRNAPLVDALEAEGAVVFGKTNLNEFAYGVSGYNPHYGPSLHPRDRLRTAGGSSSGSGSAVGAGVCRLAVGTDTSGSVRIPAACCGVYGFKSSRGAYPMDGIFPLAPDYDSVGFLAAGIEDLQRVLELDELPDPGNVLVGHLGVHLEAPRLPEEDHWASFRHQVWEVHGERYERYPEGFARDVASKLSAEAGDVAHARKRLREWRERFERAVANVDVVVGPAIEGIAPTLEAVRAEYERDDSLVRDRLFRHTPAYNELGWPALVVPTADGPRQLATRPGDEAALLAVGKSIGLSSAEVLER